MITKRLTFREDSATRSVAPFAQRRYSITPRVMRQEPAMPSRRRFLLSAATGLTVLVAARRRILSAAAATSPGYAVTHTDAEWRKLLTPEQYAVLRQADTERPFSSPLDKEYRPGIYACAGCALDLYSSRTKYDSHTGWPSIWAPLPHAISTKSDLSFAMLRTEVHCSRCGGHLGHVFDDGPQPTGLRYCMNGLAMTFKPGAA
ncbi:MAG: peptide-methionine (R)-S-oxide reductase MsrB [Steroidobacteraceae bacterium]